MFPRMRQQQNDFFIFLSLELWVSLGLACGIHGNYLTKKKNRRVLWLCFVKDISQLSLFVFLSHFWSLKPISDKYLEIWNRKDTHVPYYR